MEECLDHFLDYLLSKFEVGKDNSVTGRNRAVDSLEIAWPRLLP